ncbi:MAG TPA: histidine phosphatase family protein [Gemmataceae bacterium]|nr:histidine phosphatase family protein [Gemmataceae bacterium]
MSVLTLVRHAQASFHADNYDELSPLGQKQARLLGEFLVRRRIDFDEVYCGPRVRQRHTADIVGSASIHAGRTWPEPVVLAELDEYDLGGLLRTLAPDLARRDAAFAELLACYRRDENGPERARSFWKMFEALTMHWATTPCAVAGVEDFAAFRDRVARGLRRVTDVQGSGRRVAIFTSGGVVGTAVRLALDAPDRTALEVNWRVRNCSLTEFVFTKNRFTLDSFNVLSHLEDPTLWTYW